MTDGLTICEKQISQVNAATEILRLEAEFFNAAVLHNVKTVKGADIVDLIQYGTSEELNDDKSGYPILRLNEFDFVFIKEPTRYCDKITEQEYRELQLKQDDVLICRTNGNPDLVGRSAVIMENESYAFASYLFRVRTNHLILPHVLVAYLRGKYGRAEIDKYSMKGNQTNFSPAKFREIDTPIFEQSFQEAIKTTFTNAYKLHISAKEIYAQAESILNTYLNIKDYDNNSCAIKALSDSFMQSGRLDAEYYQHKYDYIKEIINCYPSKSLKELAVVNTGEFVEEKFYCDNGIDYIRGSDITDSVVDNSTAVKVNIDINDFKKISYGDLAFAMIGSVGNISIYKSNTVGLVSNNLGTISPFDKNLSNYILLFLTSNIGQMFFEKFQTRTAQPKIRKEDVENFSIPLLDNEIVKNLSDKLDESFRLRKEAKRLLDNAIKAVEMAIETDEETAISWLESTNGESL